MIAISTDTAGFFAVGRLRYFGPDAHPDLPAVGDHMKVKKA